MPFGASEEQALAVFTSSGEAVRSLISQRWQVTYYVLAAYVALVAVPKWISKDANVARGVCTVLAFVTAVVASWHLWNLREEHAEQIGHLHLRPFARGRRQEKSGRPILG